MYDAMALLFTCEVVVHGLFVEKGALTVPPLAVMDAMMAPIKRSSVSGDFQSGILEEAVFRDA